MTPPDVLEYYRARFQLEFCFRDSKQYAGITNCHSTDFRKLAFVYMLERFICVSGIKPDHWYPEKKSPTRV